MKYFLLTLLTLTACQKQAELPTFTVPVRAKVMLQGAYDVKTDLMRKDWNRYGILRTHQPYSVAPWNYSGSEYVNNSDSSIVDWLLLELRTASNVPVGRQAGLVRSDGTVIDMNGWDYVNIPVTTDESRFNLAVYHVNHLAIRSQVPRDYREWRGYPVEYDFTFASEVAYRNQAYTSTVQVGARFCMRAGDANGDGFVRWTGPGNDDLYIYPRIGLQGVYTGTDINMDSRVDGRDTAMLHNECLGNSIGKVIKQQL